MDNFVNRMRVTLTHQQFTELFPDLCTTLGFLSTDNGAHPPDHREWWEAVGSYRRALGGSRSKNPIPDLGLSELGAACRLHWFIGWDAMDDSLQDMAAEAASVKKGQS